MNFLTEEQKKIQLSESFKVVLLLCVLLALFVSHRMNLHFVQVDLLAPSLTVLIIGFFFHTVFLFLNKKKLAQPQALYSIFVFDTLLITSLIYYMGSVRSLFVLMYLINILLSGWVLKRQGAFFIALASSISFSFLIAIGPEMSGQALVLTFLWNNLSFFGIAVFSAYIGEYFDKLSGKLQEATEDLGLLKDLNHLIIESMPTAFISVDMLGRILIVNRAAEILLPSTKLETRRLEEILPGISEKHKGSDPYLERGTGSEATSMFDYEIFDDKEDKHIFAVVASEIYGANGIQIGTMYLFTDQTRERQLELQVKRKEKLAAIGQLAAGIAHEIRNPLASMSGSIQFLKESMTDKTPEHEKLMNIVLKETDRLNDLVSEFMDFVKEEPHVNDKVDIEKLINSCIEMLKFNKDLRKDVEIALDLKTGKLIWGNEQKLRQVILNLLINAYHAVEKSQLAQIKVWSSKLPGSLELHIQDNGCGMNEKVKARLFEPFHTTKPKGTGLGLASVHKILETHQAKIDVNSIEKQGTEFIIHFTRVV